MIVSGPRGIDRDLVALVLCLSMASCSTAAERREQREQEGKLQEGVAAQVGGEIVSIAQVRELSQASGVSPEEARARLVYDALMAAGAKDAGYERQDRVVVQRRSELARALIDRMKQEAQQGPLTDEEVAKYTQVHWLDMDRPVARRTTHVVVMPKDVENDVERGKADELAGRIAQAVRGETDPEAFKKKAEAVDAGGMKVLAQHLPPVAEDRRVADLSSRPPPGHPPQTFDEAFVKATFSLSAVGDQTPPFRSPFGTHVVLLVEVQAELRLPEHKRRKMLDAEIRAGRVREQMESLVASLRERTPPVVERNAEAMLQLVSEERSEEGP
jgi:peptidyl-prolyl cis-trans isomerase C